jgi:NADPH:quinone reductase
VKAVFISEFGSVDKVEVRELSEPGKPDHHEALVRVRAAGLNRADLLQAKGVYPPPSGFHPQRPGLEFAGEIVELGAGIEHFSTGERVFGITAGEAQSEYLCVDASLLMRIPDRLGFVEAAAIPEAFITAHDAVITQGELKSGEALLIHAVASGVGLAALQIGKHFGARVIGTSRSAPKLQRCPDLGLDVAIATTDDVAFSSLVKQSTGGHGADVILDLVGASYLRENLRSLAFMGRMLMVGLTGGTRAEFDMGLALSKRAKLIGTVMRARSVDEKALATRRFAADLLPAIETGKVVPNIDHVFSIDEAAKAYKYLASNLSFGKVVIEIS